MITYQMVERVIIELRAIATQPSKKLRLGTLKKYANIIDNDDKELLNIILSFQANEIFTVNRIYFNTLHEHNVIDDMRLWFGHRDILKTPYMLQSLLHFMSSSKSLKLDIEQIMSVNFDYICPYEWLLKNNISINTTTNENICYVCGMPSDTLDKNVCSTCKEQLPKFIEYHIDDFKLTISNGTCHWLLDSLVPDNEVMFDVHNYTIHKVGKDINFTRNANSISQYQQLLPFTEYQRKLTKV